MRSQQQSTQGPMVPDLPRIPTRLLRVLSELGDEEVEVLVVLAHRLLQGQARYGHLHLAVDGRNLRAERADEVADLMLYTGMLELQRALRAESEDNEGG